MAKFHIYVLGLILLPMVAMASACFPLKKIFGDSPHWIQATSMNARFRIELDFKKKAEIVFTTETDTLSMNRDKLHMTCLESPGKGRYLVKVDHDVGNKHTRYRCVSFTRLAKHVVRMTRTQEKRTKEEVNCETDAFAEDPAVLIAHEDIENTHCPLSGGYQLIMDQGMAENGDCKKSVRTYDPRIQFQCDRKEAGRVIADFGPDCNPAELGKSIKEMKTRHMAHLQCVASWEEKKGKKNEFSSVLLNLRDHPKSFWCLHYKLKPHDIPETTSYVGEEIYKAYLSMDGRCSGEAFINRDVPGKSMSGFMASYRPEDDIKCKEKYYLQNCETMIDRCIESTDCPSKCKRCKEPFVTEKCQFDKGAQGRWKLVNTKKSLEIKVDDDKLTSSTFGRMFCRAKAEEGQGSEKVFPVVQSGVASTCKPYYACARVHSPVPGVLNFHLRPTSRDPESGIPHTCGEMYESTKRDKIPTAEQTLTLLNTGKLKRVPCQFPHKMSFKTITPCNIVVEQCSGTCDTLSTYLDKVSCGNETMWPHKIEKEHRCYANFNFLDKNFGLLTSSVSSGRFICWIVTPTRLFITPPDMCNHEAATRAMHAFEAGTLYNPLTGLSRGFSSDKTKGGDDNNSGRSLQAASAMGLFVLGIMLNLVKFI